MKTKLNLTIDEKLIPRSKAYARKHGKTVSELVEELLREVTDKSNTLFSKKWRGRFKAVDKKDQRFEKLKERYQL
jgi:hypothetical protein